MNDTMRAAVFKGEGRLELERRPRPGIERPDDIVLRVRAVGICGSDLHILDVPPTHPAKPGVIFGHEFCGEVVEVGPEVRDLRVGDRVAIDQNPPCGRCEACRTGSPNFCKVVFDNPECDVPGWPHTPGQWWDGGMAEYVRVPSYFAYRVSDETPMEHIVVAEPLGCVLNGVHKAGVRPGEAAVVVGGGPIGLLAVMVLRLLGAGEIVIVEPSEERRNVALELGATVGVDPRAVDVVSAVREATGGLGPTLIYEAVGSQLDAAVSMAADEARIVVVGINSAVRAGFAPTDIVTKELSIHGAFLMRNTMREALDLIESGAIPIGEIVSHVLPLEEVHEGMRLARAGEALKVVFTP
ncbi:L-threonine 3-dehydrogenase [Leucobacter sp. UCD-THU]|jgi:threonine dehydrogenase-like Zn-dependent dehydrogenase|uniref:zinc-dependent alcohol dehydrogenase n=1 Tax=Leucobacter sp. UCD-THU TaxID=1292023 RepID=UPI0003693C6D|nr:alcohol dehydrogenase catalytic domain-containing protein [Leucobacter sp. UCD-THU]EYT54624.1 L-threonine 3-dehydrogenase [Leucobacter sp. UCD-THU]